MKIRCLSLWQPWGSAMTMLHKRNETRPRASHFFGLLAIHAAQKWTADLKSCLDEPVFDPVRQRFGLGVPRGAVIGVCVMSACVPTEVARDGLRNRERLLGNYGPGRYAYLTSGMLELSAPVPLKGHQGAFYWEVGCLQDHLRERYDAIFTRCRQNQQALCICLHCGQPRYTYGARPEACSKCQAPFALPYVEAAVS